MTVERILCLPNITSTRKKNKAGKCCFHDCDNPLPKEAYHYMGFLACEACGKIFQDQMKKWQDELFVQSMQNAMSLLA